MTENTGLELLITVVLGAADDGRAREACLPLLQRVGGRIVESGDCSDEEPGCWSVTISRSADSAHSGPAALSRAVRTFLRELGSRCSGQRVACEPPAAWAVIDDPELVGELVPGGERLLLEAWAGGPVLPDGAGADAFADDPDEPAAAAPEPGIGDVDEHGRPRVRLQLLVDVVTERRAGAEWPARALAARLSGQPTITDCSEHPPVVRVALDLGPSPGEPAEIVLGAVTALGGDGWSRLRVRDSSAMSRWSAAPTPRSGIAAVELNASVPDPAQRQPAG